MSLEAPRTIKLKLKARGLSQSPPGSVTQIIADDRSSLLGSYESTLSTKSPCPVIPDDCATIIDFEEHAKASHEGVLQAMCHVQDYLNRCPPPPTNPLRLSPIVRSRANSSTLPLPSYRSPMPSKQEVYGDCVEEIAMPPEVYEDGRGNRLERVVNVTIHTNAAMAEGVNMPTRSVSMADGRPNSPSRADMSEQTKHFLIHKLATHDPTLDPSVAHVDFDPDTGSFSTTVVSQQICRRGSHTPHPNPADRDTVW